MQRKGIATDASASMTSVAAPSSPSNSSMPTAAVGSIPTSSTASLPPTNHAHFTPRPPPAHTKTSAAGTHSPSAALPVLALPANMGNNLNTNGGGSTPNPTGSPAPYSQATPPLQLAKPPSVVTRLPYNPRKISAATPPSEVRIDSPAVAPNSPNSASARLPFTPSTPNAAILPSTPLMMTNSLLPPAQHAPSPLGSAYDEVRIPTSEILPSASTTPMQKIPSVSSGLNSMDSTPSTLSLPSAHQVVPLPANFFHPSPAPSTPSITSAQSVNLPNILIPASPALPSPILWSQAAQLANGEINANYSNAATPTAPTSPGAMSTTPSNGLFPVHSPTAANSETAANGAAAASPTWPAPNTGPAVASTTNPQSSTAPFGTNSMDSRQWAQLLLKYRASGGEGNPTAAAAPSSRSNAANNVSIVHTLAQGDPPSSAVSPTAGNTVSVNISSSVIAPLFPSPNVLTSAGVSRPPSSRGKSRPQSHRTSEEHEGDPEKQAMANELNRLRAVIAMQTHAQQSAAAAAASVNTSSASLFPSAALPAPIAPPSNNFPPSHPSPSVSTPVGGGGGPGLSWNTAFAALSNTFLQQHPSPSPQPIAQHTPLHIAGNTTPFNASEMNFTPLPSPAVTDSGSALSHPDYRSTFRSMSMLIRSGSAAHATSTNTSHAASHFPPHPPAITHLIRSRSAEDSAHGPSHQHHHSLHQQPALDASASFHSISNSSSSNNITTTITTAISTLSTTSAATANAAMDEIEEDLLPPRGSFEVQKEQHHLRATLSKSTPLSPRHMANSANNNGTGLSEEKDVDLGDVYAQQHADEDEDGDGSHAGMNNAHQTDSDEQIEIEEESHLRRNDSEEPDSPNLAEIEMEDENGSATVVPSSKKKVTAKAAVLHRMHASPPPLTSQAANSNHALLFPSPTTASGNHAATSISIAVAAPTTALSIASSPVSSPPPSASAAGTSPFRKSPRFACTDAQCVERQRKDRSELMRSFAEENQASKQRHAAAIKSIETRLRREIQLKDNRVQQLEKIQSKLLQPHSKLVQQNEELLAYISRLQQQVQDLGATPLSIANGLATSTASSTPSVEKSSPAFKSRKLNNHANNHNGNNNNSNATCANGHSSLNASPTSAQLNGNNNNAPDIESSPVSGVVENDITPSAARSSPFSFIEAQPVQQEPFFNTSAPRTVTGKARRRSQSFANGLGVGERTGTAGKGGHGGGGGRQQNSPAAAAMGVAVEGFAVGAASAASSTISPRSSIINTLVAAPPRPAVTQFHSGRQRKTSVKAKDLPPSGSHQNLAALEAVSAPVTTRKAHLPRPQATVTVVQ